MNLPLNLQNIIDKYLAVVRSDANHYLRFDNRLALYQAFGVHSTEEVLDTTTRIWWLEISPAARVLGWLSVLTARKVLHLWPQDNFLLTDPDDQYSCDPSKMLEMAEAALAGKIDADALRDAVLGRFYYGMSGPGLKISLQAENVMCAAYAALEIVTFGIDSIQKIRKDFADYTLWAYAAFDPFKRRPEFTIELGSPLREMEVEESFGSDLKGLNTLKLDDISPNKSNEFWELWLTEAIPQAWQLGS